MNDFFEGNSVSMEVFEMFDMYREEKSAKRALKQVYRELKEEYDGEIDMQILVIMSVYYCGLKHGFCDEQLKEELQAFSQEVICNAFGDNDGAIVFGVLTELLSAELVKQIKIKKPYNIGSRKWNVGDVFAYSLDHLKDDELDFKNSYALIHCVEKEIVSNRTTKVKIYVRICHNEVVNEPIERIFEESFYLPSFMIRHYYMRKIISPHSDYPTDRLLYLGNITQYQLPQDEQPFPEEVYCPLVIWKNFDLILVENYKLFKKYNRKTGDGSLS